MAQGRPPRRSKRRSEPVTIDLEAEKSAEGTDAETGGTPAGDDGVTGEGAAPIPETATANDGKAANGAPDANPERGPSERGTGPLEAEAPAADAATPESAADAAKVEEPTSPSPGEPDLGGSGASGPQEAEPRSGAVSVGPPAESAGGRGLVAGLVGGVIVAALVLGLQATGILPSPGSSRIANTSSRVADLGGEVDALKSSVAELKNNAPQPSPDVSKAVDALQAQVKALSGALTQLRSSAQSSGASSASDLAALKDRLAQVGSRVDDLTKTVAGLKSDVARAGKETGLATIVAATALKSAIDRGGPFVAELKVYQRVAPASQVSQKLQDIASAGVPSHAALVERFPDVADSILSAVRGNSADTGLFDRLINSARSVIKVRPTGNVSGNSPSAIVARMETKLKAGDLKGVVDEWSSLPAAGRKASQSFIDQAKKRMTALQAADNALQDAMSSTDKQG